MKEPLVEPIEIPAGRDLLPQHIADGPMTEPLESAIAKLADDHQKSATELVDARRKELAPQPDK